LSSHRDGEHRILSAGSVRKLAAAASASSCAQLLVRTEAGQVAAARIGDDHDVTAVTAVTAVRPAAGHVLLAPEVDRAVAATARDGRQARPVVEHDLLGVDD
jgi:hypothetical protein